MQSNQVKVHNLQPINPPKISKDFHNKLRSRFVSKLKEKLGNTPKNGVCFFKGIETIRHNWEDTDRKVQQESNFWYLFGVDQADCYATIDIETGESTLFVPKLDEAYKLWMTVFSLQELKKKFNIENAIYVHEIQSYLQTLNPEKIFVIDGICSDSGLKMYQPQFPFLSKYSVEKQLLYPLICNLRVIKTEEQLQIMKYVSRIGSQAHLSAMKSTKVGLLQNQISSVFQFQHAIKCGCQTLGFPQVNASGRDCATLHYIDNQKIYQSGQLSLQDMGGKWHGYATDQAITFPVDGKFSQKQREIYTAVYEAQKRVAEVAKEGSNWTDMHLLAEEIILNHLITIGLVNPNGATMKQLQDKRVGAIFFPHGLGHFVGLVVHDVGGYVEGEPRSDKLGLKSLRTRRNLESNMVLTVQPGIYFVDELLKKAFNDPEIKDFFNMQKIQEYRQVGGVRLEDIFIVRKDGLQKISDLPRSVEDVEAFLAL